MQSIKISVTLILVLLTVVRCDDFLDKPLQGELTQESFPKTPSDALLAVNGVYNVMRSSSFHQGLFPILDIMSDDARKGSNPGDAASTVGTYDRFQHIPTEGGLSTWWNTLYEGVKRANVVLEYVPAVTMDENLKNRYVAEARFLRGMFYFDIVRAWGDAPIVLTTITPANLPRSSSDEIFELIIDDLLAAAEILPEKSQYSAGDLGRATRGAAKALLAKVYLFRGDFVNAEKYALEVINSGQYDLEPEFADATGVAGEFGVESVFEIGSLPFDGIERGGNQYANIQGVRGLPNRGWGFNRPSIDLMNTFETNDPRYDKTIIFLGETLDGVLIEGDVNTPDETRDENGNIVEMETYNQKVWTPGADVPTQYGHNKRIIRYADVLLMAAEALNENNKSSEALLYLNQVRARARAGNPVAVPDITETNVDVLRDLILHERRVELALEGHRFWDLVRTGRAAEVLGPLGFVQGKHELLPIPQSEMDLAQGGWEQNPQWE